MRCSGKTKKMFARTIEQMLEAEMVSISNMKNLLSATLLATAETAMASELVKSSTCMTNLTFEMYIF